MNITKQEAKALGYQRIRSMFTIETDKGMVDLFTIAVNRAVIAFSNVHLPAYSFLNFWNGVKQVDSDMVWGIKRMVVANEPLVSALDKPTEIAKRKFRNSWDYLWQKFGEACDISPQLLGNLSSLGLLIPIALGAYYADDDVCSRLFKDNMLPFQEMIKETPEEFDATSMTLRVNSPKVTLEDISLLCSFFNMVIGWDLYVTEFEGNYQELITLLVVRNDLEFGNILRGEYH